MFVIRGTKKFLDRAGRAEPDPPPSTTALGDWYATVVSWKPQVALLVSERTLLPVLVPFAPAATIAARFVATLPRLLERHGTQPEFVEAEMQAMGDHTLAKTANRSLIGMLTEFTYLADAWHPEVPDLDDLSIRLADVPCGPLYTTHVTPGDALAAAATEWGQARS